MQRPESDYGYAQDGTRDALYFADEIEPYLNHLEAHNKSLLEEINCLRSVIADMCTEIEELGGTGSPCFFTQWTRAEALRMDREK